MTKTGLTALVGDRVYPMKMPEKGLLPAITYFRVSGERVHSLRGPSGLASPRIQFDCYAEDSNGVVGYKKCKQVAEQLRLALDGFRGLIGAFNVQGILLDGEEDMYEEAPEIYRVSMDFIVWHQE